MGPRSSSRLQAGASAFEREREHEHDQLGSTWAATRAGRRLERVMLPALMGRSRGIAIIASLLSLFAVSSVVRRAGAVEGPGCDAGAPCPDLDGDGFPSCACAASGTACDCNDRDPATFPGAPESCSSTIDLGCDGDAGGGCKPGEGCLDGLCVPECRPLDDFGCDNNSSCATAPSGQHLCAPPDCTAFGCPPGQVCTDAKECVPSCSPEVRCPYGQICRGAGCVDPCAGIVCPEGAVCAGGLCTASCGCAGAGACPPGRTCDPSAAVPTCIDAACAGITCPAGTHCEKGTCADDCAGVVCPPERLCRIVAVDGGLARGACVDLCSPNPCRPFEICNWRDGRCIVPELPDGGLVPVPGAPGSDIVLIAGAGFTCTTTHLVRGAAASALVSAGTIALFVVRRRRRRR